MLQPKILVQVINQLQKEIHENNVEAGWWKERDQLQAAGDAAGLSQYTRLAIESQLCALHVTEISEAVDGMRGGNKPDDKIPEFSCVEAELADAIIRILDHAAKYGYRIGDAIITKVQYNTTRGHKHGNKSF